LGDYNITATDLKTITKSRFETAKLRNKLVVMLGETDFDNLDNTQLIKKLVSGKDPISIEYKNKGFCEYVNYAKLLIATNSLPATDDKTDGWFRRWLIIDFPNQFSEKKDILLDIPQKEYENLGCKSIGMLMDILGKREFTNEGSILDRKKKYEEKSDPIEKFLKEYTEECFDGSIWKGDFEKKLNGWCRENKHREMSEVAIGKKMKDKSINQRLLPATWLDGKQCRAWIGIKWKGGLWTV
jgi:putative DNA primase/helicase